MSKYRNRKRVIDGITFDSGREADRYLELKLLERQGIIEELSLQVPFVLLPAYTNGKGKRIREMKYIADFVYTDCETGETVVEDVKGYRTKIYQLKKKLFEERFHPLTITEV